MNSWFVLVLKKKKGMNIVGIPKVLDVTEIHYSSEKVFALVFQNIIF